MAGWNGNLPSTLEIMDVRNCLDVDSLDLGTLCSSEKVNPWSRYRPGYWYNNAGILAFHRPLGINYTDNRVTTDPVTGSKKQLFCLHHFFGYNHAAEPAQVLGGTSVIPWQSGNIAYMTGYEFSLGEVNWRNDKSYNWWSFNALEQYVYVLLIMEYWNGEKWLPYINADMDNSDGLSRHAVWYYQEIPSSGTISIPSRSLSVALNAGGEKKFRIKPGFGITNEVATVFFPEQCYFNFTVKRYNGPSFSIVIDENTEIINKLVRAAQIHDPTITSFNTEVALAANEEVPSEYKPGGSSLTVNSSATSVKANVCIRGYCSNAKYYSLASLTIKHFVGYWEVLDNQYRKLTLVSSGSINLTASRRNSTGSTATIFQVIPTIPQYYLYGTSSSPQNATLDMYQYVFHVTDVGAGNLMVNEG